MEWRLVVRTYEPGVNISACLNQGGNHRRPIRIVTRPVGRDVQQRPRTLAAMVVLDACVRETRMVREQPLQRMYVTGLNRVHHRSGRSVIGVHVQRDRGYRLSTTGRGASEVRATVGA
jgi:hypothetical protein